MATRTITSTKDRARTVAARRADRMRSVTGMQASSSASTAGIIQLGPRLNLAGSSSRHRFPPAPSQAAGLPGGCPVGRCAATSRRSRLRYCLFLRVPAQPTRQPDRAGRWQRPSSRLPPGYCTLAKRGRQAGPGPGSALPALAHLSPGPAADSSGSTRRSPARSAAPSRRRACARCAAQSQHRDR